MSQSREMLGSRLGFLLLSAGCAIGLGNVWRFPYITGAYGGAVFVGVYLLCLLAVLPVMIMEFAVGRASRSNMGRALKVLPPEGTRWHIFSKIPLWGSYLLSMFYTTVTGWMLAYCWHSFSGNLSGLDTAGVASFFGSTLASPFEQVLGMTIVVGVGCLVCAMGVQKGVERVVKVIMVGLLAILVLLVVRSLTLPGAGAGVSFYLAPDVEKMQSVGWYAVLNAAMTQAFFTLSVGIGNMTIFGSYQSKDRSLTGEALWIMSLDTFVAIMAGLIIFPACFAFSVAPNSGPGLIFITLPNIFSHMAGGRLWGSLFFLFMSFAAFSTVLAVFENILACCMDLTGCSRRKASAVNVVLMILLSLPCVLGFNVLSGVEILGGNIMDLEDFLVSNILLPLGSLLYLLFCVSRRGWGWNSFIQEANTGRGLRISNGLRFYMTYILPCVILLIFLLGMWDKFFA